MPDCRLGICEQTWSNTLRMRVKQIKYTVLGMIKLNHRLFKRNISFLIFSFILHITTVQSLTSPAQSVHDSKYLGTNLLQWGRFQCYREWSMARSNFHNRLQCTWPLLRCNFCLVQDFLMGLLHSLTCYYVVAIQPGMYWQLFFDHHSKPRTCWVFHSKYRLMVPV